GDDGDTGAERREQPEPPRAREAPSELGRELRQGAEEPVVYDEDGLGQAPAALEARRAPVAGAFAEPDLVGGPPARREIVAADLETRAQHTDRHGAAGRTPPVDVVSLPLGQHPTSAGVLPEVEPEVEEVRDRLTDGRHRLRILLDRS